VTSRKLGNRRFLKPGCDQLFRAARNDNQACKRGARRAGEVYTVRYDAVNAMLLNEFLKEHRKVEQQETTIAQLKSAVTKQEATATEQQKEIPDLTTSLKEQAFQIQKVSAQLEASKPAPQVVNNP
jgi:septal ring factor EnvC (AmiA/AmiB activator)